MMTAAEKMSAAGGSGFDRETALWVGWMMVSGFLDHYADDRPIRRVLAFPMAISSFGFE